MHIFCGKDDEKRQAMSALDVYLSIYLYVKAVCRNNGNLSSLRLV